MPPKARARPRRTGAPRQAKVAVRAVQPCLVFQDRCEEAVRLYTSLIQGSRIVSMQHSEGGPIPKGGVAQCTFDLGGTRFTAFDGGPHFVFSQAFSIMVTVRTQAQIDALWGALTADGGEESRCGWLVDRFGVSWQILPEDLGSMLGDASKGNTRAAMEAMLGMGKLDIAALRKAYRSR
jgi:predicted 3-demethylubiquinone-9 3-methyltransferase (glyoxalase superfamily)